MTYGEHSKLHMLKNKEKAWDLLIPLLSLLEQHSRSRYNELKDFGII